MIEINDLTYVIEGRPIIENFSVKIRRCEVLSFLGPNGCGKSTILSMITGQSSPLKGTVRVESSAKGGVGMVFQDYRQHLLPYYSVRDNILFPLKLAGTSGSEQSKRIGEMQQMLRIGFDLNVYPYQLSGGQAQLASLARALIINPSILILDEPFSALDSSTCVLLQSILLEVIHRLQLTTILVSHNIEESILISDRILVLSHQPMHVRKEIVVELPRPRDHSVIGGTAFGDLYRQAISALDRSRI